MFIAFMSGYGQSAEIRLDTGDLRYCWLGVPYFSTPMPEPMRGKILTVTSNSPATNPPEWRTVATFPLPTSNNSHAMCRGFYVEGSAWIAADPEVARLVFEDIGDYILATNAQYSLPACTDMLSPFDDLFDHETGRINPNWRSNASVQAYLKRRRDERATPRVYYEARAEWVPAVLRVRLVRADDEDLVAVLGVIQNRENFDFGKQAAIAHGAGSSGIPPGVSTIYLERREGEGSARWSLFGGGATKGVSHHEPE